jgi:DNA-binding NarL/FixJ family response regulator
MIRVLIVEDEPRVRRCLRQRLELEMDLEVVDAVADGESALAFLDAARVDVVVLDVRLPGIDGLSVAASLRARGEPARVIVHTIDEADETRERAVASGAVFVAKQELEEPLLAAIRAA